MNGSLWTSKHETAGLACLFCLVVRAKKDQPSLAQADCPCCCCVPNLTHQARGERGHSRGTCQCMCVLLDGITGQDCTQHDAV
ncbi:hypothetical protein B0O80DRAFT_469512 [Mortierella sp. GBAus27b]|nr:hypothetical protein B0O80DRAFT_469512 [Mortierella sp. GBAus27b]